MYICLECGYEFKKAKKLTENHSLDNPPYEKIYVCPVCNSGDIEEKKTAHCHCCGAKILKSKYPDYCCEACKIKGEKLKQKETEYKERLMGSPIYTLVRELEEYNNRHKTKYSYGQYIALVKAGESRTRQPKAKDKKKCKKVKKNT